MKNTRAEMLSQRPPMVGRGSLDRTYQSPTSHLSERQAQVLADMEAIESRQKKGRAFQLGISVEEYDQHMMLAQQQRLEAEKLSTARVS